MVYGSDFVRSGFTRYSSNSKYRRWSVLWSLILLFELGLLSSTNAKEERKNVPTETYLSVTVDRNVYAKDNFLRPRVLVVSDRAKRIRITCQASCPVQWTLDKYRYATFPQELKGSLSFWSKREFADFWSISSYKYTATMNLDGSTTKLTGNYSCTCADEFHKGHESIYIYWEGSSGSYLLQAGENRKITQDSSSPWVRIYCGVSKPGVSVFLFAERKPLLPDGESVIQDIDGFLINISTFKRSNSSESLKFVCSLGNSVSPTDNDDFAEIARYELNRKIRTKETITLTRFDKLSQDSKGLVHYDTSSNSLICCSKLARHRQVGFYCENPQECKFIRNRLSGGSGNAPGINSTCTWYTEGFDSHDGAVVFRCDDRRGLEAEAEKFYGLNSKSYFSIEEAKAEKWNLIHLRFNVTRAQRFQRSSIRYQCQHSSYLFAEGLIWMVVYMNGSQVIINLDSVITNDFKVENIWTQDNNYIDWIELRINNINITQLACIVPLWNSDEWWNSTLDLHLEDSVPPTFTNPDNEEVIASADEFVELNCISTGYPKPTMSWQKDGKAVTGLMANMSEEVNEMNTDSNSTEGIQTIRVISTVSFRIHENNTGNYICFARSDVGETRKTFAVGQKDFTVVKIVGITAGVIAILLLVLVFSLRKIAEQRKALKFLSKKEIDEFEKGNPEALARLSTNDYTNDAHHLLPYNTDYEVPKQMLTIDYGMILGQGTYGMVLKGKLKRAGQEIVVAVKTIKPNEDASHFKILLCELKIMAYIGSHPNILSLVGAHTRNIRDRELFVATEFCENGSLLDLLRNSRAQFRDVYNKNYQNATISFENPSYMNAALQISTAELLKWSAEIATGMEFLGTKRVIHGDLATRNILLGANRIAKVGDFGLSKHIFQYSTYQKKTVQLLPWKAMALEALTDMIFSLQSDVWAYGVTLWEIFTLAQTPYPGMVWDDNFISKLKNHYRLPKPQFATQEIYELMLTCWMEDPGKRPSFGFLKQRFEAVLESGHKPDSPL